MRVGVVAACDIEINPLIEAMRDVSVKKHAMVDFHAGRYGRLDVVALFSGVCKVNAAIATQVLIDMYDVSHIIMVGVAGAIDKSLHISDTVISSEIAYHDVAGNILTEYHPWMDSVYFKADDTLLQGLLKANADDATVKPGRMVTGEVFIHQEGRSEIIEKHNPLCVDMETAAVAHVCHANAVPFAAVRSISDTPHESGADAFEKYFEETAKKSVSVLRRYLDTI